VMQALERRPDLRARLAAAPCIEQLKFLAPVGPGARVRVALHEQGAGLDFELHCGGRLVARGRLR
jgi:acyl dehydratase